MAVRFFESWAKSEKQRIINLAVNPVLPNVPFDISYNDLAPITQFYDTDRYDGLNASAGINQGMAEYTNANFFSGDTIFAAERYSTGYKHYFPYPKKSSTDLQAYIAQIKPLLVQIAEDGIQDKGMWIKKERDGETIDHFVRTGRWTSKIYKTLGEGSLFYRSFYRDEECHKDYASLLIPRAVGYSAGLLNYFFRGELDMESDPNNSDQYIIKNLSNEDMSGVFSLYYDDASDNRHLIRNWNLSISANGEASGITFTPPDNAKESGKYMLVFRGQLGHEEDSVAGKVVSFEQIFLAYVVEGGYVIADWQTLEPIRFVTETDAVKILSAIPQMSPVKNTIKDERDRYTAASCIADCGGDGVYRYAVRGATWDREFSYIIPNTPIASYKGRSYGHNTPYSIDLCCCSPTCCPTDLNCDSRCHADYKVAGGMLFQSNNIEYDLSNIFVTNDRTNYLYLLAENIEEYNNDNYVTCMGTYCSSNAFWNTIKNTSIIADSFTIDIGNAYEETTFIDSGGSCWEGDCMRGRYGWKVNSLIPIVSQINLGAIGESAYYLVSYGQMSKKIEYVYQCTGTFLENSTQYLNWTYAYYNNKKKKLVSKEYPYEHTMLGYNPKRSLTVIKQK